MKITSTRESRGARRSGRRSDADRLLFAERTHRAYERVGKTWIEELQWLVDFAQRPRERLTHELCDAESTLVYEVAWFGREMGIGYEKSYRSWIVKVAESLERELRSLLEHGYAVFQAAEVTFVLNRRTDEGWKRSGRANRLEAFHRAKDPITRFILGAYRILEIEGVRLRECAAPGCRRIFVRQKRGIFCSKKCSQREQIRRYRERHPEHAKIRQRQYYERKSTRKRAAVIVPQNPRRNESK